MRFLAAVLALLLLGVANAIPSKLQYPVYIEGKTTVYDVWINITSSIPGMSSQVSKSAMNMEFKVYGKNKNDVYISIDNVKVSNSVASVGSFVDPMQMQVNSELQEHLRIPIKATFEDGKVKSYTLDNQESVESKKIKKTLLRHFEVRLEKQALKASGQLMLPLTYNHTKPTPVGNYSSHYIITSSPYPDFPKELNVINITRTDNYEGIPYMAYHTHHNFAEQGCPGVCKKDHVENRFSAGCPAGYEPHHTPMKKSFVQHHNLKKVPQSDAYVVDIIETKETHVADIYDQNMDVTIQSLIRNKHQSNTPIVEPTAQKTYTDLHEWSVEADETEINKHCEYITSEQAVPTVKEILNYITKTILDGSIDGDAKNIGEKLVLLQKAFSLLKRKDLKDIQKEIVPYAEISNASEEDKTKRQLWLDNLPLIGTSESIAYIVDLIKNNINEKRDGFISLWESKNILEDLPMNIYKPNIRTIPALSELLEALSIRSKPGFGIYYSAAHMAVARVIRNMCAVSNGISEVNRVSKPNHLQMLLKETDDDYNVECPKTEAKKFVMDIAEKLKGNTDRVKRIIYIDALTQTGLKSAIPVVRPYVQGFLPGVTPSYLDYVRTVAINALHNLVEIYPKEVKDIVLPIYTNKTEPNKIRTAAFSVFARSYPTLGDLQHIAEESWHEPSQEVGSFVTSTLETFGNSTIPCDQLTARRVKKVLPLFKRFAIGKQHAQNVLTTIFDEIRGLGINHRFEFTPSNESFIPSGIYASLGYNADSLKDVFFKYGINSQGFNTLNLWDNVLKAFKLKPADNIPTDKESEIFPEVVMANRGSEFWRFTFFQKFFYSMSYYYMDEHEYQTGDLVTLFKQHIKNFFTWEGNGKIHGRFVKLWLPSSYQSKAFAETLPYPVQFEMRNPMLITAKVDIEPRGKGYSVDVRPSYYHSMLYSNQMLNLGDCKHVGVYHEKKVAGTYPIKFTIGVEQEKYHLAYSFPDLPKKIFTYHSEAGTYTTKHSLKLQETSTEKREIKTIPSMFVRNSTFGVVGLPLFYSSVLTEDISMGYDAVPRNEREALYLFVRDYLNAGWKRKSIEITKKLDEHFWGPNTEVKVHVTRQHAFIKSKSKVHNYDTWYKTLSFDEKSQKDYLPEEDLVHKQIKTLSHLHDSLLISVVHKVSSKFSNNASLQIVHNRTLDDVLHTLTVSANGTILGAPIGVITRFAALYIQRPNEFKYGVDDYGKQKGLMYGTVWFQDSTKPYVGAKVILSHKPLGEYINNELQGQVPSQYFYPETHNECVEDVKKGRAHSVACIKAIREYAIYNRLSMRFYWAQDIPQVVAEVLSQVELAAKHAFFNHLSTQKSFNAHKYLGVDVTYINKLTDTPVVDVFVRKPTEVLKFHKVNPSFIQPISSIYSVPDTYIQYYTNNTYPATCTMMKDYVRTYDLKTIRLIKKSGCSYIVSSHCVRHKKFAVIAQVNSDKSIKEIQVYIGKHSVVLTPGTDRKYEIQYDSKSYTVSYYEPLMLEEAEKIYAVTKQSTDKSSFIEIYAEKAGIKVTYDGVHVNVKVHPRYKGELCGLCSEFDGEVVRELRGPNRCLYSQVYDYMNSCALGSCFRYKPEHQFVCDNHYDEPQGEPEEVSRHKEYEPKVRRNKVLPRDDKICFSTKPLAVCRQHDVPIKTETIEVEFHCLNSKDSVTRKLVTESKRRILGEMETKTVDLIEKVEYPTLCARH